MHIVNVCIEIIKHPHMEESEVYMEEIQGAGILLNVPNTINEDKGPGLLGMH